MRFRLNELRHCPPGLPGRPLQVCEERSFSRERNDDCKLVGAIIDRPREKRERVLGKSCFPPMDECLQFKFRTIVIGFYSSVGFAATFPAREGSGFAYLCRPPRPRRLPRRPLQVCEERSFSRERNDDCKLVGAIIDRPREAERLPYRQIILYLRRGGVSPPVVPIKSRNRYLIDAFFFATAGPKKKAWQKRNAAFVGLCAPHPRELLKKRDTVTSRANDDDTERQDILPRPRRRKRSRRQRI